MSVLESGENYLEAILVLSNKQKEVHAIDIVDYLNFSKPSVSIALKKLKEENYLEIDKNNHIFLTTKGKEIANKIYERHVVITNLFLSLGIAPEIAEADACKIEHHISNETFTAIKNWYESIKK